MKIYIISENGTPGTEVFTTLVDACKALGVSYRMAVSGKRKFKDKLITGAMVVKCSAKKRNGFKCLEEQRMRSWANDGSFRDDA